METQQTFGESPTHGWVVELAFLMRDSVLKGQCQLKKSPRLRIYLSRTRVQSSEPMQNKTGQGSKCLLSKFRADRIWGESLRLTGQVTFPNQCLLGQREASCQTINQKDERQLRKAPKAVLWIPVSSRTSMCKHTDRVWKGAPLRLWCQIQKWATFVRKEQPGSFLLWVETVLWFSSHLFCFCFF